MHYWSESSSLISLYGVETFFYSRDDLASVVGRLWEENLFANAKSTQIGQTITTIFQDWKGHEIGTAMIDDESEVYSLCWN